MLGYRAPTFSIIKETEWALPVLVEEGYRYDSSIFPIVHDYYGISGVNPAIHTLATASGPIIEVPPSVCELAGLKIPVVRGGYFRLFPYSLLKKLLRRVETQGQPLIMYLHPWELDPDQPGMRGSRLSRFRHYLNLDKVCGRLTQLLQDFSFGPIKGLYELS